VVAPAPREPGASPPVSAPPRPRRRNPWWIPPFLGRVPDLEERYFRILGFVTLGLFFEGYDLSLLSAALPHIADDLGMARDSLGFYLGWVRVGGLVGFLLLPLADRFGRRLVFLLSVVGMSVGTLATAFTQTPEQFIVCQLMTRAFIVTIAAVGVVMLAEEFPAEHRGWGIGMLGALGACGHGLGALAFAGIDLLPSGWRALYTIGAVPLLFLPTFRREIRETARFVEHQARRAADSAGGALESLRSLGALARSNPRRAVLVGSAGLLQALGGISVFAFASLFVKETHGWQPWQYSTMVLVAGGVGIIGNVVAGRVGDRSGRRIVGLAAFLAYPLAAVVFYNGPSMALPLCYGVFVFAGSAGDVVVRAFSTELFPTSQRAASAAWLTLLQTFGWIFGLWIVGAGTRLGVALPLMISAVALSMAVAGFLVLLLPETRQRELEELSHE
jgi:putative MFS transporter